MLYSRVPSKGNESLTEASPTDLYNASTNFWSEQNLTPPTFVCELGPSADEAIWWTTFNSFVFLLYGTVFIVALVGNGLVGFVVHTTPRMKTVTNYFIMNLAVGDILMAVLCIPFSSISTLVLRYWPFGAVMCKIVNYSQAVSVLVSAYTLVAISIDRYIIIMRPLKPRLEKGAAKLVVAAVWIVAGITAVPIAIVSQLERPSDWHIVCDVDVCSEQWPSAELSEQYTFTLLTLQFALPLSALVCTYARIAHVVWGGRPPGEAHGERDSRMQQSKRKMIKMMVTVVFVFTICWLPLNTFVVLWTIHEQDEEWGRWPGMPYAWFASHWLAMSHSCYNPIIYCYMNARYRRGFKQVLEGFRCGRSTEARSCRRSSDCDGVPFTEKVVINGSGTHRMMNCRCRRSTFDNDMCAHCISLRELKLIGPTQSVRAANARTEFF